MNNSLKVLFHFGAPAGPRIGGVSLPRDSWAKADAKPKKPVLLPASRVPAFSNNCAPKWSLVPVNYIQQKGCN